MLPSPTAASAPTSFGYISSSADGERELANLEISRLYLAAIEADTASDVPEPPVTAFFTPDGIQEEFPNRLVPAGGRRDVTALREGALRGRKILNAQRYEVREAHAVGDLVTLELLWVGTLAIPIGTLAAGAEMRVHSAIFLEFRDGLIRRQRNYDCVEPF